MKYYRIPIFVYIFLIIHLPGQIVFSQTKSDDARQIFKKLVSVSGVSTHEDKVRETIISFLPDEFEHTVDQKGNLIVTFGSGAKELLFIAHMDEIGLEVTSINEDGSLSVRKRGGSINSIWESKVVKIVTESGTVDGIIPPRKSYMSSSPEPYSTGDFMIDVGTTSKAETQYLGIKIGDPVTQVKRSFDLGKYKIGAGSIDDRAGCTAQLLALKNLADKIPDKKITFVWCVEEEIGLVGASFVANTYKPDLVFAVDTFVSSDAPRDSKHFANTPLGSGAVIRVFDSSNLAPRKVYEGLYKLAIENNIQVQLGITNGGNDGSAFLRGGSVDLPLSWPGLYSHSYASVLDIRDLTALADLITLIVEKY